MVRPTILLTFAASLASAWPSLQARKDEKKKNPKYFHEMPGSQALIHYDARYFAGEEVPYSRHRYVLHGLVASYLDFFEKKDYETWIAHGTLLGWWWNGRIMPWDLDLDVQVTAETMQFMGDNYNRTEHAFNYTVPHEHGKHNELVQTKYLFDINPHHNDTEVDRMNIIDARWIDMSTGMYIDLTVLKERDPAKKPGIWSCTNNHRYASGDLWPLRVTEFEGMRALVPREFEKILADEYGSKGLVREEFHEHKWNHEIKQWVMNDPKEWQNRLADAAAQKQREMNGLDPDDEEPHSHDHEHGEESHDHTHEEEPHTDEQDQGDESHDHTHEEEPHSHEQDQGEESHDHTHEEEPHTHEQDQGEESHDHTHEEEPHSHDQDQGEEAHDHANNENHFAGQDHEEHELVHDHDHDQTSSQAEVTAQPIADAGDGIARPAAPDADPADGPPKEAR